MDVFVIVSTLVVFACIDV